GTLEKDQQGTRDLYTYNYWSSPVGVSNITTNNNSYALPNIFKDGTNAASPMSINFITSGYNGSAGTPIGIADYWIWKFANQLDDDYASWQHVRSTGTLNAGEGFTMKGVANTGGAVFLEQNYVLEGKPNNGEISLFIADGNNYLVGNPYPSALDAEQFILDNGPTIAGSGGLTGTLYFWEHWGGGSHILAEYQDGYTTYNLSGGAPSASLGTSDPDVSTDGTPTKIPGRYIPVAQGFFVIAEASGNIEFNNNQRIFQKEGSASSVFVREAQTQPRTEETENTDMRMKLRIGFNSVNTIHRQLLVTVDERASADYEWGFDGKLNEEQMDDMYWMIGDEKFTIQGIDVINQNTVLPLGLHTNRNGMNNITIDKLENVPETLEIYLHDKALNIYHDLRASNYDIFLNAGTVLDRFEIVFSTNALGIDENELNTDLQVFYNNDEKSIMIVNPKSELIENVTMYNVLGQAIINETPTARETTAIKTQPLAAGTYLIKLRSEIVFSTNALGIDENELNTDLQVFYNNDEKSIMIVNPKSELIENVTMYNVLGQAIINETPTARETTAIKTQPLAAGTYLIKLKTKDGLVAKKVLVK